MSERSVAAIYPTMLSAFISRLQEMLEKHGDIPVVAYAPEDDRTSRVSAGILEYYYDGGWLDPAEDTPYHCHHWMKSRTTKANKLAVLIRADEPEHRDTIDGQPVPDCSAPSPSGLEAQGGNMTKRRIETHENCGGRVWHDERREDNVRHERIRCETCGASFSSVLIISVLPPESGPVPWSRPMDVRHERGEEERANEENRA